MGRLRRSHRVYEAWNYKQEIADLNRASEEGWQLVKGGCFNSVFEEDNRQVYRYQMDYQTGVKNRMRYLETFKEQGWEYINSTFNGWHFFRKPYDPSWPEEEYEIYTDRSAIPDMVRRWQRLALMVMAVMTFCLVVMIVRMIQYPEWPRMSLIVMYALFVFIIGSGYLKTRRYRLQQETASAKYPGSGVKVWIVAAIIVACMVSQIMLPYWRPSVQNHTIAEEYAIEDESGIIGSNTFKVYYTDNYYLDLSMDNAPALNFTIVDADGQIVYSNGEAQVELENVRLHLKKGTYEIFLAAAEPVEKGRMDVEYSID